MRIEGDGLCDQPMGEKELRRAGRRDLYCFILKENVLVLVMMGKQRKEGEGLRAREE